MRTKTVLVRRSEIRVHRERTGKTCQFLFSELLVWRSFPCLAVVTASLGPRAQDDTCACANGCAPCCDWARHLSGHSRHSRFCSLSHIVHVFCYACIGQLSGVLSFIVWRLLRLAESAHAASIVGIDAKCCRLARSANISNFDLQL